MRWVWMERLLYNSAHYPAGDWKSPLHTIMPKLIKLKDTLTPDLRRKAQAVANKKPLLTAMGVRVRDMARLSFVDASFRPARWVARKDKSKNHPLLQLKRDLEPSLRVTHVGTDHVEVGSKTPYAAVHQLGSKKKNIPARPFFPFKNKKLTAKGDKAVTRVIRTYLVKRGVK